MPFAIQGELEEKYNKLQKILNVSAPEELIFENESDRAYYAIPIGTLDFNELNKNAGTGTITWLVPDGLAHATTETSFQAAANSSGVLEATIVNNGTESVPVDYTIQHQLPDGDSADNAENGFIGVVSEHGAIELGDIKELDGETKTKSVTLLNYRSYSDYMTNMGCLLYTSRCV